MKAIATVLVATALVILPMAVQNANAQLEVTLGGGLNSPMGDYGDEANAGYAFMTGVAYRLAPFLAVGAEIGLYGNSASDDVLAGFTPGTELSTRIVQYAGMAKVLIPVGRHNLFAKGLLGSYDGTAKLTSPVFGEASISNSELGYGIGGGFLIRGERSSSFFLDVTYHHIAFDGSTIDTNFMTYSVGAVFGINLFE
jgi:hypothetical protein